MALNLSGGVPTVLLPGTGSDDDYVYRAFAPALHAVGAVPMLRMRPWPPGLSPATSRPFRPSRPPDRRRRVSWGGRGRRLGAGPSWRAVAVDPH